MRMPCARKHNFHQELFSKEVPKTLPEKIENQNENPTINQEQRRHHTSKSAPSLPSRLHTPALQQEVPAQ